MRSARVCLLSLVCVGGAFAFGLVANAAIDLVIPAPGQATAAAAKPAVDVQPAAYALASTTSTPVDLAPIKVKTIPMLYREERAEPAAASGARCGAAAFRCPAPRPARHPRWRWLRPASMAHQPGSLAISAATRKGEPDDGEVLGAAGIERMKLALALNAEQEEYWPAIAAELHAIGPLQRRGT